MFTYPYTDLATSRQRDYLRRAERHRILTAITKHDEPRGK